VNREALVRQLTASLRQSDDPPWPLIREFLSSQALDSSQVVVGDSFNYDVDLDMAYLLARDGRVFRLIVQFLFRRPLDGPAEVIETKVWDWEDVAASDRHSNDPMLVAGRRVLEQEMSIS
jgi:hypothetical protein